jgi:hypothetical protein
MSIWVKVIAKKFKLVKDLLLKSLKRELHLAVKIQASN